MDALMLLHDVPPKSTGILSGWRWLMALITLSREVINYYTFYCFYPQAGRMAKNRRYAAVKML
jgi:hypothetical protein